MKLPSTLFWRRLVVLMLFLLGSSALLAQDEPIEQTPQDLSLLFKGYLNEGGADKGNYFIFSYPINAGDQIIATVLCELTADGLCPVDPALTIFSPRIDGLLERQQWYNDDNPNVGDCVDYQSSQVTFEAPVSGDYEFDIENLAPRSGPFSLEILGSTAPQTSLILSPKSLAATGATGQPDAAALAAATAPAQTFPTLTFKGVLVGAGGTWDWQRTYNVLINSGDNINTTLTCDEHNDRRSLDPYLRVTYTDSDEHLH